MGERSSRDDQIAAYQQGFVAHGPVGDPWYDTENGCWMRECVCGRTFRSYSWRHVPTLYDHLAIFGANRGT